MALRHLLAGAALIGLMAQPVMAQSQDTNQQQSAQTGQQQLAQEDIEFTKEAAQGGLKEVEFGELAQEQAASDEVKQFGQRMVEDHGNANDQLKQIAQDKGIELPNELPSDAQQKYDELQQKSGEEFDQAYMDEMVSAHEEDVGKFQQYVETGQDPDLTGFAEQTLPVLQEHLDLAQQTQKQISAAAAQGAQPAAATGQAQQEPMATGQQAATGAEQRAAGATEEQAAAQPQQAVSIEEVLGSRVVNQAGEEVATIDGLVIDQSGQQFAVLSVGGFLGIGDKTVAIPLDELQLSEDEVYLLAATTEEQLEQMPEYDAERFQPYAQQ